MADEIPETAVVCQECGGFCYCDASNLYLVCIKCGETYTVDEVEGDHCHDI